MKKLNIFLPQYSNILAVESECLNWMVPRYIWRGLCVMRDCGIMARHKKNPLAQTRPEKDSRWHMWLLEPANYKEKTLNLPTL